MMHTSYISPTDPVQLVTVWSLNERALLVVGLERPFASADSSFTKETLTATGQHPEVMLIWWGCMPHMLFTFYLINTCSTDVIRNLGDILWFKSIEVPSRKRTAPQNTLHKVMLFIIRPVRHNTVLITLIITEKMLECDSWRCKQPLLLTWCGDKWCWVGRLSRHLNWKVCSITLGICWGCRWSSGGCMPRTQPACRINITRDESLITVPVIPC